MSLRPWQTSSRVFSGVVLGVVTALSLWDAVVVVVSRMRFSRRRFGKGYAYCLFVEDGVVGGVSGAHHGDAVVDRDALVQRVHDAEPQALLQGWLIVTTAERGSGGMSWLESSRIASSW